MTMTSSDEPTVILLALEELFGQGMLTGLDDWQIRSKPELFGSTALRGLCHRPILVVTRRAD